MICEVKSEDKREVKRVVESRKGNSCFVLSGCNAIFHGISAENYKVMVESKFKYGEYRQQQQQKGLDRQGNPVPYIFIELFSNYYLYKM